MGAGVGRACWGAAVLVRCSTGATASAKPTVTEPLLSVSAGFAGKPRPGLVKVLSVPDCR